MGNRHKYFVLFLALTSMAYVRFMMPQSQIWSLLITRAHTVVGKKTLPMTTLPLTPINKDSNNTKSNFDSLPLKDLLSYQNGHIIKRDFARMDLIRKFKVVTDGSDVIILIRIQKTGSTRIAQHLTTGIDVSHWCRCGNTTLPECDCFNRWISNVMFQTHTGHHPCGLHADWTRLHECAEDRINQRHNSKLMQRHLYITMIRDPYFRFVSEWKHVSRGATWAWASLICNKVPATKVEVAPCYETPNWSHVTLPEFMDCPFNLAINRQTRMLSDLTLVNCYNTSGMSFEERHFQMLASAKDNLRNMAFFGLTEHQELSQILFENTFNLKFIDRFDSTPLNKTYSGKEELGAVERQRIIHLNRFDVMLYQFAKDLFFQRLSRLADTADQTLPRQKLRKLIRPVIHQYE